MTMLENSSTDFSDQDSRLVDNILAQVSNDNLTSYRFRTIVKMNPYMANNPGAVAAMASSPIPTMDLMGQAGALYGMQAADSLATRLPGYSESTQRAIFGSLTRAQQSTLRTMGYEPPKRDIHEDGFWEQAINVALKPVAAVTGGIGRTVGPALSPLLDTLVTIGDMPFKAYRTVRQLDGASQFLAAATALGTTVAGLALFVPTGGASSALVAAGLTAGRIGLTALAGVGAGTATSFVSSAIQNGNVSTWNNAWNAAYNGERLFNQAGVKRASELLGDPELLNIAQELAVVSEQPGDLLKIAKQVAGVRDADNPKVQNEQLAKVAETYAKPGTPAFQQAYETLSELLSQPTFQEAVNVLEKSKISMGRDLARAFGLDPSTGAGRWVSGSIDAASLFLLDPLLIAGGVTRAAAQVRRGLHVIDGADAIARFRQVAALPEVQRKLSVVARAVEARDMTLLNRGAREYRPIFDKLVFNKLQLAEQGVTRAYSADDVVDFLVGTDSLKSIVRGIGVVPGVSLGQLRGLNRGQYLFAQATGGARDFLRGIADIRMEGDQLTRVYQAILKDAELGPKYMDMLSNVSQGQVNELVGMGLSEQAARIVAAFATNLPARAVLGVAPETLDDFVEMTGRQADEAVTEAKDWLVNTLANSSDAYRAGRILGDIPVLKQALRPFASLLEGMTTRVPRGATSFDTKSLEAIDDINDLVDLFRLTGMPSYVRTMWKNAILEAPTGGTRIEAIHSLIDSVATTAGFRLTKAGNDIIDEFLEKSRQIYSVGPQGRHTVDANGLLDIPFGVRPIRDMATMLAVPDLHLVRRATQQGWLLRATLGIPESTPVLALQNRFWKPAVLLRVGFIVRNVSEEMLSMLVRYGTGRWSQELVGRQVAKRQVFDDAYNAAMKRDQNNPLSRFDEYVLRARYDVPVGLRSVARAVERLDSGRPYLRVLENYQGYLEDAIRFMSDRFYNWAINGFGGPLAEAARRAALPVSREGAEANLKNLAKRLAFGNPYSLRRMIIGGVDPELIQYAKQFESIYLKTIMEQVGTTNMFPWSRDRTVDETEQALRTIIDPNGNETVQLVNVLSERDLATAANSRPGLQPHAEAVISRRAELLDDPVIDAAMDALRVTYNKDLQELLPPDELQSLMLDYANIAFDPATKWDDDVLHLWMILNESVFNRKRFDTKLRAMTFSESAIEQMGSDALREWARRRNEMVRLIRTAFPGRTQPTWDEVAEAVFQDLSFAPHLDLELLNVNVPGGKIVPGGAGYSKLRDQFEALSRMAGSLEGVDPVARQWAVQLLMNWRKNPDLLDPQMVAAWNPFAEVARRPTFELYMGKSYGGYTIDDEGNLLIDLMGRETYDPDTRQVSFSLSRFQAMSYSYSQVGLDENLDKTITPILFKIDGDKLLSSNNLSIDDVIGRNFSPFEFSGEIGAQMLTPPTSPYGEFREGSTAREFAIAVPKDSEQKVIVVPAGSWRAEVDATATLSEQAQRAVDFSAEFSYSPFFSSLEEAVPAMRFAAGEVLTDPRYANELNRNPRWHNMPETTPVYIVDTRTISEALDEINLRLLEVQETPAFTKRGLSEKVYAYDRVTAQDDKIISVEPVYEYDTVSYLSLALNTRSPIIVSSQQGAEFIADAIGEFLATSRQLPYTPGSLKPAVGKSYFPVRPGENLPGFTTFATGPEGNRFRVYGWDGVEEQWDNYENFPLIWDWVDSLAQEVGPTQIVDSMINHITSNVRAGRRLVKAVRDTDNVPTLYRNVLGEPVELVPGELIDGDDIIYLKPDFDEESIVKFSDNRYFEDKELTYTGSTELLWPVMGPILSDHAESGLGWALHDLKNPIDIAPIGDRVKETIYTNRSRIRAASSKHAMMTHAGDLPDWEIVQRYRPITQNKWDKVVQFGFNRIVSPTIDALTRKPMAFHAFMLAAQRNKSLQRWIITNSAEERRLLDTVFEVSKRLPGMELSDEALDLWSEVGRLVGRVHGENQADEWGAIQAIGYLRGLGADEFDEMFAQVGYWAANQPSNPRIPGLLKFAQDNRDQLQLFNLTNDTDGFLAQVDRIFGPGSAIAGRPMMIDAPEAETFLAALTNDDWKAIKASAVQRENHYEEIGQFAAEHAIRDVMPFVDSHEIRSQFAEFGRGLLPFWYAEENFLKRWGKIFSQGGPAVTLERIRRLQLTYMGLKNVGIVRTDSQGRDYFVYPGSELLINGLGRALPGQLAPITTLVQTPTERMIPGFQRDFGRPSLTPFAAVAMDAISAFFPEARPIEEAFVGKEYSTGSITDAIVPSQIKNLWNAIGDYMDSNLDPKNQRVASAMMAAAAHLDATNQGLPDDADAGQRDDYLRKLRNHARIIVLSQALAGWFTPGPAQLLQTPESGSLDWITDGKITNPAELLSSSYYELIANLGVEKGTQRYLEMFPDARIGGIVNPLAYTISQTETPSGATLPSTDAGMEFYRDNEDLLNQFPDAGPWLLPQRSDRDDTRSQWAYDSEMIENLRERRTPTEFINMMKYKEGANEYFTYQKSYETMFQGLKQSGNDEGARRLNRAWLMFADSFKATHPLFAQMLESDDARQRRRRIVDQMRIVLKDPMAPRAAHFDALKILQDSFDTYQILRGELGLDRTTAGEIKLSELKLRFRAWADEFLLNNPMVGTYWTTVLEPESGLD